MMVYLSILTDSVQIHPCVKNLNKRNHLGKDEPNINHLHIGSGGEALGDTDEEGGEDKEGGQVDSHNCFKEEVFEEVCSIDNDEDEDSWKVDCKDCVVDSSSQSNLDVYSV